MDSHPDHVQTKASQQLDYYLMDPRSNKSNSISRQENYCKMTTKEISSTHLITQQEEYCSMETPPKKNTSNSLKDGGGGLGLALRVRGLRSAISFCIKEDGRAKD